MATIGISRGITATFGTWIENARRTIKTEIARQRVYRRTFQELDGLSDRDLQDIGISRHQISDVAHDAAYGSHR